MTNRDLEQNISIPEIEAQKHPKVLLNPGFLSLWIGQLFSQLADRIFIYVLMIVAYSLTGNLQGVAIPMLAFGIPSVLFGSIAGVFVDRWDRKFILIISDFLRGAILLLPIFGIGNSLWGLFGLAFLVYSITQFFAPAESASIPELVPERDLLSANSLFLTTWMLSHVIGFGLGAPIVQFLGDRGALIVATSLYLLSGIAVSLSPIRGHGHKHRVKIGPVIDDLLAGFRYILQNGTVGTSLFKMFMAATGIAVVSVLALGYAKDVLQIGERNFGYLIIAAGIGMFVGMLLIPTFVKLLRRGGLVVVSFFVTGILLWWLTIFTNVFPALTIIFGLGVANIFITATLQTILQEKVPQYVRGRVFGAQNMLINSAFTLPPYLFALLADNYTVSSSILILGVILFCTGVAGLLIPKFKTV